MVRKYGRQDTAKRAAQRGPMIGVITSMVVSARKMRSDSQPVSMPQYLSLA
jgi:hypothetical protein